MNSNWNFATLNCSRLALRTSQFSALKFENIAKSQEMGAGLNLTTWVVTYLAIQTPYNNAMKADWLYLAALVGIMLRFQLSP
jgi:hypothetical protein